jgi:hypothetical protein
MYRTKHSIHFIAKMRRDNICARLHTVPRKYRTAQTIRIAKDWGVSPSTIRTIHKRHCNYGNHLLIIHTGNA